MRWDEYAAQAMEFCNPATRGDKTTAAFGLMSEIGELCGLEQKTLEGKAVPRDKWIDEMGDIMWRVAHVALAIGVELPEVITSKPVARTEADAKEQADSTALLVQLVALAIGPSNLFVGDRYVLIGGLRKLRSRLIRLAESVGSTADEVMESNLEKLRRRHGDAWKPHDKQNREQ